jgi:cellulase/cellobiase CelA1
MSIALSFFQTLIHKSTGTRALTESFIHGIQQVQTSINIASPTVATLLKKAQSVSTFHWLDRIAKVGNVTAILKLAAAQQQHTGRPTVASFVIYDLPDRDCAAAASNGMIPLFWFRLDV